MKLMTMPRSIIESKRASPTVHFEAQALFKKA